MYNKNKIGKFLRRFKYIFVIILGLALLTVIGENSMLQRYRYNQQISILQEEIEKQESQYHKDSVRLSELERSPEAIRKIARERYFMKADDEDIFVMSDELEEETDATVE